MASGLSSDELDRMVSETIRVLRTAGTGRPEEPPAEVRGEGTGLGGLVRAVAKPGGRLESIQLDPRALRVDARSLDEEILSAVNAALDDLREKLGEAGPGLPGNTALVAQLREVQQTSIHRMESFLQAIRAAQDQITSGRAG